MIVLYRAARFVVFSAMLVGITLMGVRPAAAASPDLTFAIQVPYRSQFDGSPYAGANCGPAALGMVLGAFDLQVPTAEIRAIVNDLQQTWDYDSGTYIFNLAKIAARYGLQPLDLYEGDQIRRWTLALLRLHLAAGHPVIPQVKYPYLPGKAGTSYWGDHYIVLYGLSGDDFLYHDPASRDGTGAGRRISAAELLKAWQTSSEPLAAVAFAPPSTGPRPKMQVVTRATGFLPAP